MSSIGNPHAAVCDQPVAGFTALGGAALFREKTGLTDRQAQVTVLAMTGLKNDAIGRVLGISPVTVQRHLSIAGKWLPAGEPGQSTREGLFARMLKPSGEATGEPFMRILTPSDPDVFRGFNEEELAITAFVSRGLTKAQVADKLGSNISSITRILSAICDLTGIGSPALLGTVYQMVKHTG